MHTRNEYPSSDIAIGALQEVTQTFRKISGQSQKVITPLNSERYKKLLEVTIDNMVTRSVMYPVFPHDFVGLFLRKHPIYREKNLVPPGGNPVKNTRFFSRQTAQSLRTFLCRNMHVPRPPRPGPARPRPPSWPGPARPPGPLLPARSGTCNRIFPSVSFLFRDTPDFSLA